MNFILGLYCEDHGMVGNYMYSEERGERFDMMANPECRNSHWWEDAEPFWITAVKQVRFLLGDGRDSRAFDITEWR